MWLTNHGYNMENDSGQYSLFHDLDNLPTETWPKHENFPLNINSLGRISGDMVLSDLPFTKEFMVVTGFTSLSYLIDTFGNSEYSNIDKTKIVLGFEPNIRGRKRYHIWPLEKEIKEYWLKEGLSILLGGSVMNLISKIKDGRVEFRFYDRLHAKLYISDRFATLGSSNFSLNGLSKQIEANIRVSNGEKSNQYEDIKLIANNYFNKAQPYEKIIELLQNLIQKVHWKDALARAIAEVLEGDWLDEYKILMSKLETAQLWPTQKRGLAQAMSILQESSNVLVADPTGAGKTKLCSTIILALKNWLWETGRRDKDTSLIVCPPLVIEKWRKEFRELDTISNSQISTGILSNSKKQKKEIAMEELGLSNILAIDEAHNYLNINTNRSDAIRKNNADFKILVTATPINKKVDDLLKIVELLDLDNLDDESFKAYSELMAKPHFKQEANIQMLRSFVSRFTVRRTKKMINKQIEKEQDLYHNALGETCKFPEQNPVVYKTSETEEDIEIVKKISDLCLNLKGITYLKGINKPKFELTDGEDKAKYLNNRLNAAKQLSIYMIRSRLRSSNMALLEHIIGIKKTMEFENFPCPKKTENKIKLFEIDSLIAKNRTPSISKIFKGLEKPIWLTDIDEYLKVCRKERAIYKEISELTKKLSGQRELGKAKMLLSQLDNHKKIIAFDSSVITLNYFKYLLDKQNKGIKVLVATGSNRKDSEEVLEKFKLTSGNRETIIALCSDKMSEGVDLQLASAVTLLDLPSVIRIVEQRFGRVDRMDTPHSKIDLYWPDDSEEFSLRGDRRLIELNQIVESIWGANFQPPNELKHKHFSKLDSVEGIIEEFENYVTEDISWEGIQDSFQSLLELKEGQNSLITEMEYEQYRNVRESVKTKVSFLNSEEEWCFFALRGDSNRSPKWYFLKPKGDKKAYTEFPEICEQLRNHIAKKSENLEWNDTYLKKYLEMLQDMEIELLPPKKKRALNVAEVILKSKIKAKSIDFQTKNVMRQLIQLFHPKKKSVDFDAYAKIWINQLQPYLEEKRNRYKTRKVYNLNDLKTKREIERIDFSKEQLIKILDEIPIYERVDNKIASCIVGVPMKQQVIS